MGDAADVEAEELVDASHPFGVAFGEVVVDGDDVDTLAGEGVEVDREGGDESFAFAGFHFGDGAFVEHHAADQLDVVMPHVEHAAAGFADGGEGLDEDVVEGRALFELLLEFGRFGGEFGVGEGLVMGLAGIDGILERLEGLDLPFRFGAEDFREYVRKHRQEAPRNG